MVLFSFLFVCGVFYRDFLGSVLLTCHTKIGILKGSIFQGVQVSCLDNLFASGKMCIPLGRTPTLVGACL